MQGGSAKKVRTVQKEKSEKELKQQQNQGSREVHVESARRLSTFMIACFGMLLSDI